MSKCDTCERTGCFYRSRTVIDCGKYVGMPKTNADRIRAMTDEELALFLNITGCPCYDQDYIDCIKDCAECIKKWLQQPAEGETHEN